ncbi:tyrosine-type recombinase/integrase [Azotobacter vinelandii]|uniref:tyrosine-type recombinase/integrase n=1 Tax=Azotobacter vinelandii TaxID=354 RepID=UPI0009E96CB6|nr:site-specific integrase [Azotobacter vinelandii]
MPGVTFDELMTELFVERWSSKATQDICMCSVRALKRYIKTEYPDEVTRAQVLAWRLACVKRNSDAEGLCEVSWNTYTRQLRTLYNFGMDRGLLSISENPFSKVNLKEPLRKRKTLPKGSITQIRQEIKRCEAIEAEHPSRKASIHPAWFWSVVVEMLYHTGVRLRQLVTIKLQDIDLDGQCFLCSAAGSKSKVEKILPLQADLIPLLRTLMERSVALGAKPSDQLFNVNRFSRRHKKTLMTGTQVQWCFKVLTKRIGARVSPHRFRHSFGTDLMSGERSDIHLTQILMAHRDIRSTMVYVDVPMEKLHDYLSQRKISG